MANRPLRSAAALALTAALAAACGTGPPARFEPAAAPGDAAASASPTATPPAASPTAAPTATASPTASPSPSRPKKAARYVFPVKAANVSIGETHSGYPASDVFADCGKPVLAATDGVVLEVNLVDRYDPDTNPAPADRGGLSVSLLGDDGVRYYGSHLSSVAVRAGDRVTAGQRIGAVGKTGRASGVCHLHFGISPVCGRTGDWWTRRGALWPQRYLRSWRSGGSLSPVTKVKEYERSKGCPKEP